MDLHPIIVHFPIALLTVYTILEVLKFWLKSEQWQNFRSFLVITGAVGAFTAMQTGEFAEEKFRSSSINNIVEMHSSIATFTTYFFLVLAALYVVSLLEHTSALQKVPWLIKIADAISKTYLGAVLALVGFVALLIVGALGGMIVYGPEAEPFTQFLYSLLF